MTDAELLDYCAAHCRTERALFHRDQVRRVCEMAGHPMSGGALPEWVVVRPAIMDTLVESARARLAA